MCIAPAVQSPRPARTLLGHPYAGVDVPSFTGEEFDDEQVEELPDGRFLGEYHHDGRLVGAVTAGIVNALRRYRRQLLKEFS